MNTKAWTKRLYRRTLQFLKLDFEAVDCSKKYHTGADAMSRLPQKAASLCNIEHIVDESLPMYCIIGRISNFVENRSDVVDGKRFSPTTEDPKEAQAADVL